MDKSNKYIFIGIAFLIIVGLVLVAMATSGSNGKAISDSTAKVASEDIQEYSGKVQDVIIDVSGSKYTFTPSSFVKGVPVRMKAALGGLPGCSRSIVIPAFGVRKTLYSVSDVIEFTPDKAGTFDIMCSMNMYTGKFTVVDSNSASVESPSMVKQDATVQDSQVAQPSGSCNMAASGSKPSGGCGCGM